MQASQFRLHARRFTLVATFLLIILLVSLHLVASFFPVILVIELIPLALTLPGQFKGSVRAYQWLCFVDLFFLTQGILLLFTPGRLAAGIAETLICLSLFVSAIIFIRIARHPADPDSTTGT